MRHDRFAHALFLEGHSPAGYVYQVVRSVEVWIGLAEGEDLYLEGAEDLDVVADDAALVEQVKDTAGSGAITLRSVAVVEAINNYWTHRANNPDHKLAFRYLTTSGVGADPPRSLVLANEG